MFSFEISSFDIFLEFNIIEHLVSNLHYLHLFCREREVNREREREREFKIVNICGKNKKYIRKANCHVM